MSLPIFKTDDKDLSLMQTQWASQLNPVLNSPLSGERLITGVTLSSGNNSINHKLGRKLQGWIIVGRTGNADVYDTQASNSMPDLTLQLVSSGTVTITLLVF